MLSKINFFISSDRDHTVIFLLIDNLKLDVIKARGERSLQDCDMIFLSEGLESCSLWWFLRTPNNSGEMSEVDNPQMFAPLR